MSIGGTLTEARQAAGLTIAEVSARTRIRGTLIRAIEHDDFGPCGGDFYARGHIRAIARVVGVDSQPLIAEYDAAHQEGPATLEDLFLPSADAGQEPPPPARGRRLLWLPWPVALLAVIALAVIGGGAYQLAASPGPRDTGSARIPGTPRKGAAASAPAAPTTPPTTTAPSSTPAPSPSATTMRQVTPSSVTAVGPGGAGDGDNPGSAGLALSGDPGSPWRSHWYTTAAFGNLKPGTGLLITLPHAVTATGVTIQLGNSGASVQVRAGTSTGSLHTVASVQSAGGTVRLPLDSRPRVRYLVVWFTRLPPDGNGTYQAAVYSVTVSAARLSPGGTTPRTPWCAPDGKPSSYRARGWCPRGRPRTRWLDCPGRWGGAMIRSGKGFFLGVRAAEPARRRSARRSSGTAPRARGRGCGRRVPFRPG